MDVFMRIVSGCVIHMEMALDADFPTDLVFASFAELGVMSQTIVISSRIGFFSRRDYCRKRVSCRSHSM